MRNTLIAIASSVALIAFAGCGTADADLEPTPAATTVSGTTDAAISNVGGVSVIANPDEWTGANAVQTELTPIKVTFRNNSSVPVRLRYDNFALRGPGGERYAALAPMEIDRETMKPVMIERFGPITTPAFTHTGFELAPFYSSLYPGVPVWSGPFTYDPIYYNRYATAWAEVELPTRAMFTQALPEGVLQPGGNVSGFVYFENLDSDLDRVTFTTDLVNASTGDIFGDIRIPFDVAN